MTTFLYSVSASADGYISGPGGDMSWLTQFLGDDPDPGPILERIIPRITAILCGRTTFDGDDPHAGDPEKEGAFEGQWEGPQVLLTHRPIESPPANLLVRHTLHEAVETARAVAGTEGLVNILGAGVARQCLEAGVVDEVVISTLPVLLGGGTPVLSGAARPYGLEVLDETPSGPRGAHIHHYRVLRR
ncbi:dihydrofolate reductase family protein [Sediminivirga luteola]|uniref:dihydrofolate reductase family protein n=1 Tax=Sediminivirga luteola TaxID=1774748 RepID=UPI001F593B1C|nr:dihydrofolate reductase family protein [Sediminivirga luteola]MCI2266583.1 dihydrofolate reductase family protein [Sediminivirga luteola]